MDDSNTTTRGNTPLNKIIYYENKVTTNKINTPDKYYENKRKFKIFLI